MPDQYIEIEWNGVRTRVPVMGTIGGDPNHFSLGTVHPGVYGGTWAMVGFDHDWGAELKAFVDEMLIRSSDSLLPDADSEYDRECGL